MVDYPYKVLKDGEVVARHMFLSTAESSRDILQETDPGEYRILHRVSYFHTEDVTDGPNTRD